MRPPPRAGRSRTAVPLGAVVAACAAAPAAWLLVRGVVGGLGANPVQEIQQVTGTWAVRLLLATLAVTPVRRLLRRPGLIRLRRPLGLAAFAWAAAHVSTWFVFDQGLSGAAVVEDVRERPWITAGAGAFACLLALALTSTRGWVRRLGRQWRRLHALIYPAAALAAIHGLWAAKADTRLPLLRAVLFLLLLGWRLALPVRPTGARPRTGADDRP